MGWFSKTKPKIWEYMVVRSALPTTASDPNIESSTKEMLDFLIRHGHRGWELVQILDNKHESRMKTVYFKRERPPE